MKVVRILGGLVLDPVGKYKHINRAIETRKNKKEYNEKYRTWLSNQEYTMPPKKGSKISVLMPTYNTNITHLVECIESVQKQTYSNWELCIVDDCSTEVKVFEKLSEKAKEDPRIKVKRLNENGHICKATNAAFDLATGDFVSLLDHDDILNINALAEVVTTINSNNDVGLIYTDEDKLNKSGVHVDPFFKPDFSPYFLRSCNYITHFTTIRSDLFKKVGGFRLGTEGAQDWDLILRVTEIAKQVVHIPKILYSWRMSDASTASNSNSKPYAYRNQRIVLRDHMQRLGVGSTIYKSQFLGFWNVFNNIKSNYKVSIVIPNKNSSRLLKNCLRSIFDFTTYSNFEVVIVDTGTTERKCLDVYKEYSEKFLDRFKVVNQKGKFNFSKACNMGAEHSNGEFLLFLNNDTKIITSKWLENLLSLAQQPKTGAVGAKLYFSKDRVQHIGVHVDSTEIAHHTHIGKNEFLDPNVLNYSSNIRECTAVTGACLMVDRKKYNEVNGFDENLRVTYNDIDLCLKLLEKGYTNLFNPYAKLYHYESQSVGKIGTTDRNMKEYNEARSLFISRWKDLLVKDRYYREII